MKPKCVQEARVRLTREFTEFIFSCNRLMLLILLKGAKAIAAQLYLALLNFSKQNIDTFNMESSHSVFSVV